MTTNQVPIKIKLLHPLAKVPFYASHGAAGFDLHAVEFVSIPAGDHKTVRLGLAFEIPPGWQIEIRPRSGSSFNSPLLAKNTIGTVDSDYRGEVCFAAHNLDPYSPIEIHPGERICQGVVMPAPRAEFLKVTELSETKRGENGFGSTGKFSGQE